MLVRQIIVLWQYLDGSDWLWLRFPNMKASILLTSGYCEETLSVLRERWCVEDVAEQVEALAYLKRCDELPVAVVVGYVPPAGHVDEDKKLEHWAGELTASGMLHEVLALDADLPVIVSAGEAHPRRIVELVREGAFGYVVEPADKSDTEALRRYNQELEWLIGRAAAWRQTILENRRLRRAAEREPTAPQLISRSVAMRRIVHLVSKVATTPATVLITGESGTGKELLAKLIHHESNRSDKPFVAINCGALNESLLTSELCGHVKGAFTGADSHSMGLIRQTGEGTLFLDEIGSVSAGLQVLLLRILEERTARPVGGHAEYPVRCRFIAAGSQDLQLLVDDGRFRQDLYYRLNVFHIGLPPLRKRTEDIPLLADHFLHRTAREFEREVTGIDPAAMELLEAYHWPGNIRELRNVIERAIVLRETGRLAPADLAGGLKRRSSEPLIEATEGYTPAMEQYEAKLIRSALERSKGNLAAAARCLKMKRTTLAYRVKRLGLAVNPHLASHTAHPE